ncbi:MAG: hypothetical protein A2Y62_16485 [Candidatus Fischerbacteria bacterium RBG_13_37_8]|uniref:Uncharacterized protein n=1 Tax=Candidatus Fischerbacteria bacterium RBG_13_37_8 TaxID=1817863 RepID=A0A1F5VJF1_9BACT|nr:MAG: hypothetical protein A2Y62_16485 [Candidatus Fischerbacteria bacterium RBG_13_37_8]
MNVSIDKKELYSLIKEAVREVLQEEIFEYYLKNVPSVSKEEMEDINKRYGKPSQRKEVAHNEMVDI